ncbi:hypothetical protein AgCh_026412 [Apium graveolens]
MVTEKAVSEQRSSPADVDAFRERGKVKRERKYSSEELLPVVHLQEGGVCGQRPPGVCLDGRPPLVVNECPHWGSGVNFGVCFKNSVSIVNGCPRWEASEYPALCTQELGITCSVICQGDALSAKSRSRGRALGLCGWASSADIPKASRRRFSVDLSLGLGTRDLSPLGRVGLLTDQFLLCASQLGPNGSAEKNRISYGLIDKLTVFVTVKLFILFFTHNPNWVIEVIWALEVMGPLTLSVDMKSSSSDASNRKMHSLQWQRKNFFASVSTGEEKPFDFLRTLFEGFVAGGTAGVVVETALYPIDTIKTRLQAARGGGQIILNGLYSGLAGNLAGVLPASALFIGVYEPAKKKLLKMFPEDLSALAHLAAGACGGLAASLIRVPTEVVKQRMQTGQFASAPNAVRLIVASEGFKGLYAGYGSFLLRDLPFDAMQFCIYEQLRIGYKLAAKRELNDPENAIIGAFAGAVTGAITTPLDVIKTRLMIQGSGNQYKGIVDCVQTIIREEGPPALIKGIGPRVLWIGIGGSIFFGVLESTKRMLAERHSTHEIFDSKKD